MKSSVDSRRPAFTMVELLVVIAIITLLIALLLPTLNRTKIKGRQILCMGNMRQLIIGYGSYAGDFDEWLPYNGLTHTTFDIYWLEISLRDTLVDNYSLPRPIWDCPSLFVWSRTISRDPTWAAWCNWNNPLVHGLGVTVVPTGYGIFAGRALGYRMIPESDIPFRVTDEPKVLGGSTPTPWFNCATHVWNDPGREFDRWDPEPMHSYTALDTAMNDGSSKGKRYTGAVILNPNGDPDIVKVAGWDAGQYGVAY